MPWYERDYAKTPVQRGPSIAMPKQTSVVFWLLVINIAVFVIDGILTRVMGPAVLGTPDGPYGLNQMEYWGYFSVDTAIKEFQVWRILTFQFLHGGVGHLFANMLGLFFFGHFIERYLGSRRFLAFYLLCGFAGTIAYIGFWASGVILGDSWVPMVGASAGVYGILIGVAIIAPDVRVLVFLMFPVQIRTLAWIIIGIAAYKVLALGGTAGSNAGGEAAHLGGAALGALLIKRTELLSFVKWLPGGGKGGSGPSQPFGTATPRQQQKGASRPSGATRRQEAEVDRILIKVRDQGLDSLTDKEKATLQKASENRR